MLRNENQCILTLETAGTWSRLPPRCPKGYLTRKSGNSFASRGQVGQKSQPAAIQSFGFPTRLSDRKATKQASATKS